MMLLIRKGTSCISVSVYLIFACWIKAYIPASPTKAIDTLKYIDNSWWYISVNHAINKKQIYALHIITIILSCFFFKSHKYPGKPNTNNRLLYARKYSFVLLKKILHNNTGHKANTTQSDKPIRAPATSFIIFTYRHSLFFFQQEVIIFILT